MSLAALIGIGNSAVKDFGLPSVVLAVLLALIGGLNFLPQLKIGEFYFSIGTAVMYLSAVLIWIFKGKIKNRLGCLLSSIILAGSLYGAFKIGGYYGSALWNGINSYYALIIGVLAFLFTRNAKYGYISAITATMTATLINMAGGIIDLDVSFTPAVIAGSVAIILYVVVAKLMPARPNKATYYFEAGRMTDK